MSQQAFSKLRMKFDHSPFETYLQLPRVQALRDEYGVRGGGELPSAGISVLYDTLHGWPLDPILTHTDMDEREQCRKHIDFLCDALPHVAQKSILTLDRGYPSIDLFHKIDSCGLKFVARCSTAAATEIAEAPPGDSCVTLRNGLF